MAALITCTKGNIYGALLQYMALHQRWKRYGYKLVLKLAAKKRVSPIIRKSNKGLPGAKALKSESIPFTFSLNCEEMNMPPNTSHDDGANLCGFITALIKENSHQNQPDSPLCNGATGELR